MGLSKPPSFILLSCPARTSLVLGVVGKGSQSSLGKKNWIDLKACLSLVRALGLVLPKQYLPSVV